MDNRRLYCFRQVFPDEYQIPVRAWDLAAFYGKQRFEAKSTNRKGGHVVNLREQRHDEVQDVVLPPHASLFIKRRSGEIEQQTGASIAVQADIVYIRGNSFEV